MLAIDLRPAHNLWEISQQKEIYSFFTLKSKVDVSETSVERHSIFIRCSSEKCSQELADASYRLTRLSVNVWINRPIFFPGPGRCVWFASIGRFVFRWLSGVRRRDWFYIRVKINSGSVRYLKCLYILPVQQMFSRCPADIVFKLIGNTSKFKLWLGYW